MKFDPNVDGRAGVLGGGGRGREKGSDSQSFLQSF